MENEIIKPTPCDEVYKDDDIEVVRCIKHKNHSGEHLGTYKNKDFTWFYTTWLTVR